MQKSPYQTPTRKSSISLLIYRNDEHLSRLQLTAKLEIVSLFSFYQQRLNCINIYIKLSDPFTLYTTGDCKGGINKPDDATEQMSIAKRTSETCFHRRFTTRNQIT